MAICVDTGSTQTGESIIKIGQSKVPQTNSARPDPQTCNKVMCHCITTVCGRAVHIGYYLRHHKSEERKGKEINLMRPDTEIP